MADLPRKLSLFDGAALLVGTTIGSGIFVVPSLIAQRVPEPGLVLFIWAFSGLLVLCGALALAELGAMLPQSGGLYVCMREAYGPFWAFLYGWTVMLVVIPGSIAALCSAFLLYLAPFVPLNAWGQKALGIALLLALAFVNARGVKLGARVQNVFTVLKVAGIASLVGMALLTGRGDTAHFSPLAPEHLSPGVLSALGVAMIATLFAYDGWHFVGFVAGEIEDPGRNLPRSIFLGIALVVVVYLAANLAYIYVLGQPRIAASERVATDAMSAMIGPRGANLITVAILCSIFGALSANILAGPRVFFAMARDGSLFPRLAAIHPRHETPANAIWALAGWAGFLTLTGGYAHLITMSQFANWIFFTMVISSVMVLRHTHPEWSRPYRALGYPWTVVLFALVSSAFVLNTLLETPRSSLLGLGLLLLGIPLYRRRRPAAE
jgi:APA family basic amino acid/polyamine antiporter